MRTWAQVDEDLVLKVKNMVVQALTASKSLEMALEITRKYPGREGKDQILEWYLNYNFYGNAAYGIEAAARVYYDKSVADLTLDEIAVLAAIPQYPGLNPIQEPGDAYRRHSEWGGLSHDSGTRSIVTRRSNFRDRQKAIWFRAVVRASNHSW